MPTEINVIVKDSERTMKQKFLCYEKLHISEESELLKGYIEEAIKNFGSEPEDIIIKTTTVYK